MSTILTEERLKEVCDYDPETGALTWRIPRRKCKVGALIGSPDDRGYLKVKIDYRIYYIHRLAWLYMTGAWPTHDVDHIDRNKANNAWGNLRAATQKQNSENVGLTRGNRSGIKGVSWSPIHKKWRARIKHNYKGITLGYFDDVASAVQARKEAELTLFTHSQASRPPS